MVSQTRATPQSCKLFFCNSNPLAVKSHSLCPKHYQRYRRHNGNVLDNDTKMLLLWLFDHIVQEVETFLKNSTDVDCRQRIEESMKQIKVALSLAEKEKVESKEGELT